MHVRRAGSGWPWPLCRLRIVSSTCASIATEMPPFLAERTEKRAESPPACATAQRIQSLACCREHGRFVTTVPPPRAYLVCRKSGEQSSQRAEPDELAWGRPGPRAPPMSPIPMARHRSRHDQVSRPQLVRPGAQLTTRRLQVLIEGCREGSSRISTLARRPGRLGRTPGRLSESLASTSEPSSAATSCRLAARAILPLSSPLLPFHWHI